MKNKVIWIGALIGIVVLLVLINGYIFINFVRCNSILDCGRNQYCEAGTFKCKDIINECITDDDCLGYETCEKEEIGGGWACKLGEECPSFYRNICKLTEKTIKYCKQDSVCVWAFRPNTCCDCPQIYNEKTIETDNELVVYEEGKDYSSLRTVDCSGVVCSPCVGISELECVNNQCEIIREEYKCPDYDIIDCMPIVPSKFAKYCKPSYRRWIEENCNVQIDE